MAKEQAWKTRRKNTKIRKSLEIVELKAPAVWECQCCSAEYPGRREKCVKCGSYQLERFERKLKIV